MPLLVRLPMDVQGGRLEAIVPRNRLLAGYRFQFEVEAEWQKFTEPIRWVVIPAQKVDRSWFRSKMLVIAAPLPHWLAYRCACTTLATTENRPIGADRSELCEICGASPATE